MITQSSFIPACNAGCELGITKFKVEYIKKQPPASIHFYNIYTLQLNDLIDYCNASCKVGITRLFLYIIKYLLKWTQQIPKECPTNL